MPFCGVDEVTRTEQRAAGYRPREGPDTRMAHRSRHHIDRGSSYFPDVTTWNVESGDVVVVHGVFTREEVRTYVDLIDRVYPEAGLTVIFSPPGVDIERIARMANGWEAQAAEVS